MTTCATARRPWALNVLAMQQLVVPGAKREHIGNIRAMSNAARRDAAPAGCIGISDS